jgi:TolB protein
VQFSIDASDVNVEKTSITFEKNSNEIATKILENIKQNLQITGLFRVLNSEINVILPIEKNIKKFLNNELNEIIKLAYGNEKTDSIFTSYMINDILYVKLWDIIDSRELFELKYDIKKNNVEKVANLISDEIFKKITGEKVNFFDTKLLFVADDANNKKRITIMDFNGSNLKYLTDGRRLVLTPIFSKYNKNEIIYLEFVNDVPKLFKLNLITNRREMIRERGKIDDEMTFSPNFEPTGSINEIVCSKSKDGDINLYRINLEHNKITRITKDTKAIHATPSYSPDGKKIVFVSNKTEKRKLYTINIDGTGMEQITINWGQYDKPVWSPDGKLIAFIRQMMGEFYVGLITPNGKNERLLIHDYLIEGIKWSPNSRYLIYTKQKRDENKIGIYTLDIITGREYKIPTPNDINVFDVDWI